MDALTVQFPEPGHVRLQSVSLAEPAAADIVIAVAHSGISTGTERLLYAGRMPAFPGLSWPLVPGYESVGTVIHAGPAATHQVGDWVFVPGGKGYEGAAALFGGASSRILSASERAVAVSRELGARGALLALAATAHHVLAEGPQTHPELIVGHGVFGQLLARLIVALGSKPPVVWEKNARRRHGAAGYAVIDPADDDCHAYQRICDASGDISILDTLISRLGRQGQITLAGFYDQPARFDFPPAFMREVRLRICAEWLPADLQAVAAMVNDGSLSLDGLITHHQPVANSAAAYAQAFSDDSCLKMILDWLPQGDHGAS